MKKILAAVLAAGLMTTVALPAQAKKTIRLTSQLPATSVLGKNVAMFKKEVEEATKGEIEIQIFDSGQLYDDGVFDPRDTRTILGMSLSACHSNEIAGRRGFGVFRM